MTTPTPTDRDEALVEEITEALVYDYPQRFRKLLTRALDALRRRDASVSADHKTIHGPDQCGIIEGWLLNIAQGLGCDTTDGVRMSDMLTALEALRRREADAGDVACHHGWRGAGIAEVIRTKCPRCGGQVFVGAGGFLTCASLSCPQPDVGEEIEQFKRRSAPAPADAGDDNPHVPERREACPFCDMGIPLSASDPKHEWYDPERDGMFEAPCYYDQKVSAPDDEH